MTFFAENLGTIIVGIVVAIIIIFAVRNLARDRKEGRCSCGSCSGCSYACQNFNTSTTDKNEADYPYTLDLKIKGMTCAHCASKIENALNLLGNTWAIVNLENNSVHILSKDKPDKDTIIKTIADAGYEAK